MEYCGALECYDFAPCSVHNLRTHLYINDVRPTKEQIEFYRRTGHVTIDGFFTASHIETWRNWIDETVRERANEWSNCNGKPADFDMNSVENLFEYSMLNLKPNLRFSHAGIMSLFNDVKAVIGRVATELEGWKGTRIYDEHALIKEPHGAPTHPHYDGISWAHDGESITAWVPLDEATETNGCMYMFEGSQHLVRARLHELGHFPPAPDHQWWNIRNIFREGRFPEAKSISAVPVPVKLGGISFHSGLIIHGAGPNWTADSRRAVTFAMMPSDAKFNGSKDLEKIPNFGKPLPAYQPGDELNDEELHTLMYGK
jgi:hypothetical protein